MGLFPLTSSLRPFPKKSYWRPQREEAKQSSTPQRALGLSSLMPKTKEEVEKGWLSGPHKQFGTSGRISRRFAVVQSQKVRPVDNYNESQVSDAVTIANRCTVDGVDTIAATGAMYLQGMREHHTADRLLGRSFDLKSAYRQLAVSDASLKWARLAVYDPHEASTRSFSSIRCRSVQRLLSLPLSAVLG